MSTHFVSFGEGCIDLSPNWTWCESSVGATTGTSCPKVITGPWQGYAPNTLYVQGDGIGLSALGLNFGHWNWISKAMRATLPGSSRLLGPCHALCDHWLEG
uniref:Uncharacterized protein n=1 Tax=Nelumbo nucifera TaxID=4432 RepID=A0A822ZMN3_NELNU|nr:TPA_asm: hypothetical protein HUJ06_001268 [Nelumbo nucifera]